ncbi:hypothetical protein AZH43_01980 [Acinetobacter pragensis]|uniref:Uncharacterized protein n=1 Tax=Acinetobacter pragensis TaxID=1806892 RepID=A0A151Y0W6_9GAMM|nr:hypothetical protein AZH43_01980 [Acinetobacter pragensis]
MNKITNPASAIAIMSNFANFANFCAAVHSRLMYFYHKELSSYAQCLKFFRVCLFFFSANHLKQYSYILNSIIFKQC